MIDPVPPVGSRSPAEAKARCPLCGLDLSPRPDPPVARAGTCAACPVAVSGAVTVCPRCGYAPPPPAGPGSWIRRLRCSLRHLMPGRALAAALLFAAFPAAVAAPDGPVPVPSVSRARYLMGTLCEAEARGEGAAAALDAAFDEIARLEQVLSDYRPDSELSRLNAAAGAGPVACSMDLLGFVRAAARFSAETAGAFDITVGALIDVWDLRGRGHPASPAEVERALTRVGWSRIRRDDEAGTIALPAGMKLDPGALGKGYALDEAGRVLRGRGIRSALIDFGGQLLAIGPPSGEPAWEVSVAQPLRRDEAVLTVRLRDASISTSGNSERGLEAEGRPLGHIVDPRSGLTVAGSGSATAIAPTGAEADAYSTALLVMGPERGLGWAERRAGIAALFLTTDGAGRLRARASRNLQTYHPSGLAPDGADPMKGTR